MNPATLRQTAEVLFVRRAAGRPEVPIGTLRLDSFDNDLDLLSRAPGNVSNHALGAMFEVVEGRVRPLLAPEGIPLHWATRDHGSSSYVVRGEGLLWMPRYQTHEQVVRLPEAWLFASHRLPRGNGLELRRRRAETGTVVVADRWPEEWYGFLVTPSRGGLWLMDEHGGYLRTDAALRRLDAPGLLDRLGLVLERFQRFESYVGFDTRWKISALPLALLFTPSAFGALDLLRRARRRRGDLRPEPTALVALACLAVTLAVAPWFWSLTTLL